MRVCLARTRRPSSSRSIPGTRHRAGQAQPGALHSAHSIPQSGADDERSSSASWGWLIAIVLVLAAGVAYAFWQGWLPQHWLAFDWLPKLSK